MDHRSWLWGMALCVSLFGCQSKGSQDTPARDGGTRDAQLPDAHHEDASPHLDASMHDVDGDVLGTDGAIADGSDGEGGPFDASALDSGVFDGAIGDANVLGVASRSVGPSGGTVALPSGTRVEIPAGALSESITITLTEVDASTIATLPDGYAYAGTPVAFEPHGTVFTLPVTITMPFTGASERLDIARLDDETDLSWEAMSGSLVGNDNTISVSTLMFSIDVPRRASGVLVLPTDGGTNDDAGSEPDAGTSTGLQQVAYLKASNTVAVDHFGFAVGVSGDTVVVGARFDDSASTGVNGDQSGSLHGEDSGAVRVFTRDNDQWSEQAYLKASNTNSADYFGYSVAIDGDTIVVGAPYERSGATGINGNQADNSRSAVGAVYVFVRNGSTWIQQAYLKPSWIWDGMEFGGAVAISGDTIVVGSIGNPSDATGVNGNEDDVDALNSGAAYVFVRAGTIWSQQAFLKGSNTETNDRLGEAVAISGDTIAISSTSEASSAFGVGGDESLNDKPNSGAVYVFVRNAAHWSQQAYIKASNSDVGDVFGESLAVHSNTLAVGARFERSNATGINGDQADNSLIMSGAVYVFVRDVAGWSQQAYLKPAVPANRYSFGDSLAVHGNTLVVGAPGEPSNATGVNGDQTNTGAPYSGAAYVFMRNGATWTQNAYVKASNTQYEDSFGHAVAYSGGSIAVGAYLEDSNATGVNGNQSDNSTRDSGAVYLFE